MRSARWRYVGGMEDVVRVAARITLLRSSVICSPFAIDNKLRFGVVLASREDGPEVVQQAEASADDDDDDDDDGKTYLVQNFLFYLRQVHRLLKVSCIYLVQLGGHGPVIEGAVT